jgi:hypothetical protein
VLHLYSIVPCELTHQSGILPSCFDIYFQRLETETAVILPSSPTTVTGLKSPAPLQKWWGLAKRHAFRQWPYLINSTGGIFLVTKTVKTKRYAHCLSKGSPGQISQVRIHGNIPPPKGSTRFSIPSSTDKWEAVRNDLAFKLEDCEGKGTFTIFMERDSCCMFALTDAGLKEAASRVWRYVLGDIVLICQWCLFRILRVFISGVVGISSSWIDWIFVRCDDGRYVGCHLYGESKSRLAPCFYDGFHIVQLRNC